MKLLGANESPEVVGVNKLGGKSNYFIGNVLTNGVGMYRITGR